MSKPSVAKPGSAVVTPFEAMLSEAPIGFVAANAGRRSSADAGRQRAQIRAEAESEGYRIGFEQGLIDGHAAGQEQAYVQAVSDSLALRCEAIESFRTNLSLAEGLVARAMEEWFVKAEEQYAELAVLIASRILRAELSVDRDSVMTIVREALAEVTHAMNVTIRLNPFDAEILREHKTEILAGASGLRTIEIVDDPTIAGGCVIDSEGGRIDATLEAQLKNLAAEVRQAA